MNAATLLQHVNWAAGPLGPRHTWPESLRAIVDMLLACEFPMVALWGPELVQIYNDGYAHVMGAKHPDGMGQPTRDCWLEMWPFNEPIYRRVQAGETVSLKNQLLTIRRHGFEEDAYFNLCFSPLRDGKRDVAGVLVTVFETTDQVKAEAALHESEARSRGLIEAYAQSTWEADEQGGFVQDSPTWRALTGQSQQSWGASGWIGAVHPEEHARAEREWKEALAHQQPFHGEFRIRDVSVQPHGYRWVNVVSTPVLDAKGKPQRWLGMSVDIDEKMRIEEHIHLTEHRLQAFMEATTDAVYTMSPDWKEMRNLDGHAFLASTDDPSSTWWSLYIPEEARPRIEQAIQTAIQTKTVFDLEHPVLRGDGRIAWTRSRAVPMVNAQGNIVEWVGTASDITPRFEATELRAALAERNALLAEVHHRVKNNLQVITSMLEMQAQRAEDPSSFASLQEACNRVVSIAGIHELLYQSNAYAQIDLMAYARKLVPYLMLFYGMQDRLEVSYEGDAATLDLERAVPFGLLLNELVSNICKHAYPNQASGRVRVKLALEKKELRLDVFDDGAGFTEREPGTPATLGLQIVSTLTEQLKGTVRFLPQSPGTHVQVCFPRHRKPTMSGFKQQAPRARGAVPFLDGPAPVPRKPGGSPG